MHEAIFQFQGAHLHRLWLNSGKPSIYRCEETSDATLIRFIEWAYRGDYSETVSRESALAINATSESSDDPRGRDTEVKTSAKERDTLEIPPRHDVLKDDANSSRPASEYDDDNDNELLAHANLHIFASLYFIEPLARLTFVKLTSTLKKLGDPRDTDAQIRVVELMQLVFGWNGRSDFHDWLGRYAARYSSRLRSQPRFQEIAGVAAPYFIQYLNDSQYAPWER